MSKTDCCCNTFLLLLLLLFCKTVSSQESALASSASYDKAIELFKVGVAANSLLYIGKEYPPYRGGIQGTPFFVSSEAQSTDLFYDGNLYLNVPAFYDLVRQQIVINRFDDNSRIRLLNEKIDYFIISGHRVENLFLTEVEGAVSDRIFYEVLLSGKTSVLVRRIKKIEMTLDPQDPPKFTERDELFVRTSDKLVPISRSASVLTVLGDRKDLVKTFIRKNKLKFKKDVENDLIKTVAYYNSLTDRE